jgi:heme-degrading monooxygenase HmoA
MIVRCWKTGLKPGRGQTYEEFAREISLSMFRQHQGFLGCVMSRSESEGSVATFWRDMDSISALEDSGIYRATVARIHLFELSGVLNGK